MNAYKSTSTYKLLYGVFGIQALENAIVTPQQIESTRRTLVRNLGGFSKVWIRIFPHFIMTNKPKEVRMGRGKGDFKTYVAQVKTNSVIFEVAALKNENCVIAINKAITKLPMRCQIIRKGL